MARSTNSRLASARSEFGGDPSTYKLNEMDFKMGQMEWNGFISRLRQSGKITPQRGKELTSERYAWRENRNKERREAKPAKEAEAKRIAGLSEKLVSEMQPHEVALAQRIFEGTKEEQASAVSTANNNPNILRSIKVDEDNGNFLYGKWDKRRISDSVYDFLNPEVSKEVISTKVERLLEVPNRWVVKDKEASEKLAERLVAEGKNVKYAGYNNDNPHLVTKFNGTTYAIPIIAYKQREDAPTDGDIMKSAKSTAKEVISSYAQKLVVKTEDLVGKGGEFTGKPKIVLQGSDPWRESKVELNMGGKKITWKTKMIWNTSKLRKDFNQFPTRLVSQEDA